MRNILHLTIYRKWFDEILAGTKKVEYRMKKPYWKKRFFNSDGTPKKYDFIVFTNGYGKERPRMSVEFKGIRETEKDYEILLGNVFRNSP